MSLNQTQFKLTPPIFPPPLFPPPPSSSSSSSPKITPIIIFIIIILALLFFIAGLLHLLIRLLIKKRSSLSLTISNNYNPETQLQSLFNLHDSGLDQTVIESLPIFQYSEIIVDPKEPFDCAVCLSEFSPNDKLRLLPLCSHAFHIHCIDTWLLSNSSCPLCRGTLFSPGFELENPVFGLDDMIEEDGGLCNDIEKRVFSVRLGKFRNGGERKEVEASSSSLDARRCFSMGNFQYVLDNSNLQIAMFSNNRGSGRGDVLKPGGKSENVGNSGDVEGKRIIGGKNESFSVSKIWLWSKKDKFSNFNNPSVNINLPWTEKALPV